MLIISPDPFFPQSSPGHSPQQELIFHIMKSRDQTSVFLSVHATRSIGITDHACHSFLLLFLLFLLRYSDAGRWKTLGRPVVIGGENLPSLVRIGLTDLQNIGGPVASLAPRFRHHWICMMFLIVILAVGVLLLLQPETEEKVQLDKIRPQSMLTKLCWLWETRWSRYPGHLLVAIPWALNVS